MAARWLLIIVLFVILPSAIFAPQSRPFSADDVEYLLRQSVNARRVTALVDERGVNFSPTN